MRQFVIVACTCWFSLCTADDPNTLPLLFGMTPDQAAGALGTPLNHLTGRSGDDIYVADSNTPIPGFYAVGEHLFLQFRKGHLTGWKYDWRLRPHFPL
jgi:hypothetical protein